jgi:hypothetical protein
VHELVYSDFAGLVDKLNECFVLGKYAKPPEYRV